jgi:hypothetical protein
MSIPPRTYPSVASTHWAIIRATTALQVAVLEHLEEDCMGEMAIKGVEAAAAEIAKLVKKLKKED